MKLRFTTALAAVVLCLATGSAWASAADGTPDAAAPASGPPDADAVPMPAFLPADVARGIASLTEAAATEYAMLLRSGQAHPSGEDLVAIAQRHLAPLGLDEGVREPAEAWALQRIQLRSEILAAAVPVDAAAGDASQQ